MTLKKDFLKHQANTELTLINEYGEKYALGYASDVIPMKNRVKFRWPNSDTPDNIYPFTYAILHDGNKMLSGMAIQPLDPSEIGKTYELTYTLDS